MRKTLLVLFCFAAPGLAQAIDCSNTNVRAPVQATVIAPISTDLATPAYRLGSAGSVLAQAYDETQSLDQVLLRLRIEGCANVAKAMPAPSAINPNDPAAYKPQTEFDNTPWRFDMSQNGKRMTAEEFDAWMKSRGVRVAKGNGAAAAVAAPPVQPAATTPAPAAEAPKPPKK
jgi:hypothetical protein